MSFPHSVSIATSITTCQANAVAPVLEVRVTVHFRLTAKGTKAGRMAAMALVTPADTTTDQRDSYQEIH